jgi:hypothetical protein
MWHVRNKQFNNAHIGVYFSNNAAKALKPLSLTIPYTRFHLAEEHNKIIAGFVLPSSVLILVLRMKCLSSVLKQDKKCAVPLE